MTHNHKYILDKNNFGICKCGATKQFPKAKPKTDMPPWIKERYSPYGQHKPRWGQDDGDFKIYT